MSRPAIDVSTLRERHRDASVGVFVSLALVTGILYAILTPPFQASDEWNHFYRAWAMSDGHFTARREGARIGFDLPSELPALVREIAEPVVYNLRTPIDPALVRDALWAPPAGNSRVFVSSPTSAYLTPFAYLPQAVGLAFGRLLACSPLGCHYLGRLVNLLVGIVLVALALRAEPWRPWLLTLLALAPMAGFLRASMSPDVVTMGVAFWLTARVASLVLVPDVIVTRRAWLAVMAGTAALCLTKVAYAPLALVAWTVSDRSFGSSRAAWRSRAAQAGVLVFTAALSSVHASQRWAPFRQEVELHPARQLSIVASDPLRFAMIACEDYLRNGDRYLAQIVGQLGWLAVSLPKWLLIGTMLVFAWVWWLETRVILDRRMWMLIALLVATILGILSLSQYAMWTQVGADSVDGIQGRYLLPLVPIAAWLLPLRGPRQMASPRLLATITIATVVIATAVALDAIVVRYYPGGWLLWG